MSAACKKETRGLELKKTEFERFKKDGGLFGGRRETEPNNWEDYRREEAKGIQTLFRKTFDRVLTLGQLKELTGILQEAKKEDLDFPRNYRDELIRFSILLDSKVKRA